jgi:hypothetical protein
MLPADTEVQTIRHSPEEAARLRRQAHGEIRDDETPLPLPLAPEPTRTDIRGFIVPEPVAKPAPAPVPRPDPVALLANLPVIDDSATIPVPLMEMENTRSETTPPPLPPSPASAAAEVWLEDAVTRPSMISDLAVTSSAQTRGAPLVASSPAFAAFAPDAVAARNARRLLILSSATSFAVGLVLGALLFRGRSEPQHEPAGAAVCGPAETPDAR